MSDARPVPRCRRDSTATRQLWADRLERFRNCGLTVAAFCAAEGVSVPAFYQWKRQLAPTTPSVPTPTVVPVRVLPPESTSPAVEVVLPSGTLLRFGQLCDPGVIAAVLKQIGVARC